jgi:hypothetical protein
MVQVVRRAVLYEKFFDKKLMLDNLFKDTVNVKLQ